MGSSASRGVNVFSREEEQNVSPQGYAARTVVVMPPRTFHTD